MSMFKTKRFITRKFFIPQSGGVVPPGAPAFGALVGALDTYNNLATYVIGFTGAVPVGARVVLTIENDAPVIGVAGVTDSKGQVYTLDGTNSGPFYRQIIYSFNNTVALTTSDTVTITMASTSGSSVIAVNVCYVTGTTAVNTSAFNSAFGSPESDPFTTTAASVVIGIVVNEQPGYTYTPAIGWTIFGSPADTTRQNIYRNLATPGSYNTNGTWSGNNTYHTLIVAYS